METKRYPRSKSIRLKCLQCACEKKYINVKRCKIKSCELWPYRLKSSGLPKNKTSQERNKAIKKYCKCYCCNDQRLEVKNCPIQDCPLFPHRGYKMIFKLNRRKQKIKLKRRVKN